jgi:hypothetical protein
MVRAQRENTEPRRGPQARSAWVRFLAVGGGLFLVGAAAAHEPIFGVGPHVVHQYGIGAEVSLEGSGAESDAHFKGMFALTEDAAVSAMVPRLTGDKVGWGNVLLRAKWRFYRADGPRGSNQAAVGFGLRLPAQVGVDSTGYLFLAAVGREARREYFFAGLRYMRNSADARLPDVLRYDVAVGVRPIAAEYLDPDLVVLVEWNGQTARRGTGRPSADRVAVGPGVILTYRNVMLKAGVDLVLREAGQGVPFGDRVDYVLALEQHFSPFSFLYGR